MLEGMGDISSLLPGIGAVGGMLCFFNRLKI